MEKMLLVLVLFVVLKAYARHHPRFPNHPKESLELKLANVPKIKKVACTPEAEDERHFLTEQAKCGAPKEVFERLKPTVAHELIFPEAIWIKKCVGLCEENTNCIPLETRIRKIPIRIYNVNTEKYACGTYSIEEHVNCGCCATDTPSGLCNSRRVFNPRKCSCQCPNLEERRNCLTKRNQNMKWNRYNCACEPKYKRRTQSSDGEHS